MSRTIACAVAAVFLVSGCAGGKGLQRESSTLRARVQKLEAERRRDKRRIRDLQKRLVKQGEDEAERPLPVEVRAPVPAPAPRPDRVVTPEGEGEIAYVTEDDVEVVYVGEAAEDTTVRPRLELSGTPKRYRPRARRAATPTRPAKELPRPAKELPRPAERLPVVDGAVPAIDDAPDPREVYRAHYEALEAGDHAAAIAGFRAFIADHPRHEYADNARYWLGEAYYDQRDYKTALREFRKVVTDYPKGNKVAGAMLKSAYCYESLGYFAKARDVLGVIVERYPKTNAAVLAADRLVDLQAED